MFTKLLEWLTDLPGNKQLDNDDVTIDIAIANYQLYLDELKQLKKSCIKHICDDIKKASRRGRTSITLLADDVEVLSIFSMRGDGKSILDFFIEAGDYFDARGFGVTYNFNKNCPSLSSMRISWLEDEEADDSGNDQKKG